MIITNKHGLPQQLVDLCAQEYTIAPNEYRTTSLLKGIRETLLLRRHSKEIQVDVADMIWLLFGTAVHHVLEQRQEAASEIKEERLKYEIGDYVLSGQFDLYCSDEKRLTDYKTASVWKVVYKNFDDWEKQQTIYGMMLDKIGFDVEYGRVWAFLKDHSKAKAKYDPSYPDLPVYKHDFKLHPDDFILIEWWLQRKFHEINDCQKLADDSLPLCSEEERWYTGTTYAVMKKGRKSALRVLDSQESAELWMEKNEKGDEIVVRQGEDKKCMEYCWANTFCDYWRRTYGQQ